MPINWRAIEKQRMRRFTTALLLPLVIPVLGMLAAIAPAPVSANAVYSAVPGPAAERTRGTTAGLAVGGRTQAVSLQQGVHVVEPCRVITRRSISRRSLSPRRISPRRLSPRTFQRRPLTPRPITVRSLSPRSLNPRTPTFRRPQPHRPIVRTPGTNSFHF